MQEAVFEAELGGAVTALWKYALESKLVDEFSSSPRGLTFTMRSRS